MKKLILFLIVLTNLNAYTQMSGFYANQTLERSAAKFVSAAGLTVATQKEAVNSLVNDTKVKYNTLWTAMKSIYPFIGGTATTHKYNLKDPRDLDAAYRLTFGGTLTHNSSGITPNGTTGYANTYLIPNDVMNVTDMSAFGYYSKTTTQKVAEYVMGGYNATPGTEGMQASMIIRRDADLRLVAADFPSGTSYRTASDNSSTDGSGFYVGSQQGASIKFYRNGSSVVSNTGATLSLGLSTVAVYLFGLNEAGTATSFTDKICAFSFISITLSDTEVANLNTAVTTFQTTLGRQN